MELNEKWKLTTQNNAYLWEGNQISKQNRYPCTVMVRTIAITHSLEEEECFDYSLNCFAPLSASPLARQLHQHHF